MKSGDVRCQCLLPSSALRRVPIFHLVLVIGLFAGSAASLRAEESPPGLVMDIQSDFGHREERESWVPLETGKTYVLGVHRFALDGGNEVLGWKLSERWYFGRQRGDDSGLALIWQNDQTRFSLTHDGVRVSRSF